MGGRSSISSIRTRSLKRMRTRGGKRIFLLFHVFYLQVKIQEEEGEGGGGERGRRRGKKMKIYSQKFFILQVQLSLLSLFFQLERIRFVFFFNFIYHLIFSVWRSKSISFKPYTVSDIYPNFFFFFFLFIIIIIIILFLFSF